MRFRHVMFEGQLKFEGGIDFRRADHFRLHGSFSLSGVGPEGLELDEGAGHLVVELDHSLRLLRP